MSAVDENTSPQSVGDLISAVERPHKAIVSGVPSQSEKGALPQSYWFGENTNRETLSFQDRKNLCNNSSHEQTET